jgi:hypothetical protein
LSAGALCTARPSNAAELKCRRHADLQQRSRDQYLKQLAREQRRGSLDEALNAGRSLALDQAVIYALRCLNNPLFHLIQKEN